MADLPPPRSPSSHLVPAPSQDLSPPPVQVWVDSRSAAGRWRWVLMLLLTLCGLSGAVVLLVFSLRWGMQMMLNPQAVSWLSAYWSGQDTPSTPITTLEALQAELTSQDLRLGDPITVAGEGNVSYQIYPIRQGQADTIVELRVYQPQTSIHGDNPLQRVAVLPITAISEAALVSALGETPEEPADDNRPSQRQFPLTQLIALPNPAAEGIWLTLEGRRPYNNLTVRFGQIVHFDASQSTLTNLIVWASPADHLPTWTDLDAADPPDLLINKTVGMEPSLAGYRVLPQTGSGIGLASVPLHGVPLEAAAVAGPYRQALNLGHNGLWSEALSRLQQVKADLGDRWTDTSEAQLRLVEHHAVYTQRQADQTWAIPSQQIVAYLIDGRWQAALDLLEESPAMRRPLMRVLETDDGRFWNRVNAARQLDQPPSALWVWGGLLLKAQEGDAAAQNWLAEHSARSFWGQVAALSTPPPYFVATAEGDQAAYSELVTDTANTLPVTAVMGRVMPVIAPDQTPWYQNGPLADFSKEAQSVWYEIDVFTWRWADQWRVQQGDLPWSNQSVETLWQQLQPLLNRPLELYSRTGKPVLAQPLTLRGLTVTAGQLKLLATGSPTEVPLPETVAVSAGALVWPSPQPLSAGAAAEVGPILMTSMNGDSGDGTTALQQSIHQLATNSSDGLTHQRLDLTGDGRPETLLFLNRTGLSAIATTSLPLDPTIPKTLILDADGTLIYTDLQRPQQLVALQPGTETQAGIALLWEASGFHLEPLP